VFENRVLRKVFGPRRVEVTGEWRNLHNEELNDLVTQHCSGNKIEKNEMGGSGAYGGGAYAGFWWGNLRERDHLGDPEVVGKIILR